MEQGKHHKDTKGPESKYQDMLPRHTPDQLVQQYPNKCWDVGSRPHAASLQTMVA